MSSDDIANLYRQFGGQPDNYQELGRDNVVRQSRERWPLLANVRQQEAARAVRPVTGHDPLAAPAAGGPLPTVFDEAAAATAAAEAAHRPPIAARPRPAVSQATPADPVEPVLSAEPLAPAAAAPVAPAAPVVSANPAPFARPAPSAAPFASPPVTVAPASVAAGNELQGMFARLARPPEPAPQPADRETSILRRLLRP